jgi:2-dehydro-3-deoxyphosphogluconate aldolase/(4S)-4-hydroxy-2-oxoglutarate aldolase
MDSTNLLADVRLLPVVVIEEAATAMPLARTLAAAGIRAIEFTLRTEAGLQAIEQVARADLDLLIGAGSVLTTDQLAQVQDAGAQFAVSPGHTEALIDAAGGFPYLPGATTASECMQLRARGYRLQKFFPAEQSGGVAFISALSAPLPDLRFCVTGGINAANVTGYLQCPAVSCIGGSWFVPRDALLAGDFDAIGKLAREAIDLVGVSEAGR